MRKVFLLVLSIMSCISPQISVNKNADFSKIKRVAVVDFKGPESELASEIVTITLLKYGADVVERQQLDRIINELNLSKSDITDPNTRKKIGRLLSVDAFIVGNVTNYKPQTKYLMKDNTKSFNNINEIKGKNLFIHSFDPTTDTYILETTLEVGLTIRMIDVETGSVMWAGHLTYEGLDLSTTLKTISEYLIRSLMRNWNPQV